MIIERERLFTAKSTWEFDVAATDSGRPDPQKTGSLPDNCSHSPCRHQLSAIRNSDAIVAASRPLQLKPYDD